VVDEVVLDVEVEEEDELLVEEELDVWFDELELVEEDEDVVGKLPVAITETVPDP